jgi:(methylthio)acryloyl-CoA hydratase
MSNLILNTNESVLQIIIDRSHKRNAINDSTMLELESILDSLSKDIRCIIINGNGNHFSAGLDLSELKERDLVETLFHSRMWHRILDKIEFCTCPVIAALHGAVVGGGLELASACHIRVADDTTFYALPEGMRGIYVGGGASVRLPKLIGTPVMMDMMLTGRVYQANETHHLGFSQYIVEGGASITKATELAKKIIQNTGLTNYAVTHVLPRTQNMGHNEALMMESLMAAVAADSPEAKKRLTEFLEGKAKKINE